MSPPGHSPRFAWGRRFLLLLPLVQLALGLQASARAASSPADCQQLQVVALSFHPPAGTVDPAEFARFDAPPVLNHRGQVALLAGPAVSPDAPGAQATSVWLGDGAHLELISRAGGVRAGDAAFELLQFSQPQLNNHGDVWFSAEVTRRTGLGAVEDSFWHAAGGSLDLLAATGSPAADAEADARWQTLPSALAVNDAGDAAFFGQTQAATAPVAGLWLINPNGTTLVARGGTPVHANHSELRLADQSFAIPFGKTPILSATGRTVFRSFFEGPGVVSSDAAAVMTYHRDVGLSTLVRGGDEAPGTNGEPFVSFPTVPGINAAGDVVFTAFYGAIPPARGDNAPSPRDHASDGLKLGVWVARDQQIEPRLLQGSAAAGIAGHARFVDVFTPVLNANGAVAMIAAVEGADVDATNELGIWSDGLSGAGQLDLVARQGDAAPGTSDAARFHSFFNPAINAPGQTAFLATLAGPGISDAAGNVLGLWAQDRGGTLRLIARSGQQLTIAPGDVRTIGTLVFAGESGGEDGRGRGFNDLGQVVFRARFTDGTSAVLLSGAATVPEPAGHVTLLAFVFWLNVKRKEQRRQEPRHAVCEPTGLILRVAQFENAQDCGLCSRNSREPSY